MYNGRSREYVCPLCKVKNIELLPDTEPSTANSKPTEAPVVLSFGYQKDQISASESTSITSTLALFSD